MNGTLAVTIQLAILLLLTQFLHEPLQQNNLFIGLLLEFECHLDLQVDSSNNVCNKCRMKIQTEQNKPHRKLMSIAQEFTVSFIIIISSVTIVYIGKKFESIQWM